MVRSAPSNDGGIGGRGKSATVEDFMYMNKFTTNYFVGRTNVLAAKQPIPFFTPHYKICHIGKRSNHHQARNQVFLHDPQLGSSIRGSLWAEAQVLCSFRNQSRQFDHGTRPSSPACNESKNISVLDESTIDPPTQCPCSQSSARGSCWAESEAMMHFRSQLHHFARGSQAFLA
jgi:hypothetical protein